MFTLVVLFVPLLVSAQDGGFALLTGEDGPFSNAAGASDLPAFLNQIYLLCIGIAVVVSILQIIRGGITWMLTDSVMEKGQAKHLVTIAIMGLLLVLSPVIVFNIINPCILSLSLSGTEECEGSIQELKPGTPDPVEEDPILDPTTSFEKHGTYIHYGRKEPSEIWAFQALYCKWTPDGVDVEPFEPPLSQIVCGSYHNIRTYALCGAENATLMCNLAGAFKTSEAAIFEGYERECSAIPGTDFGVRATVLGIQYSIDPDSFNITSLDSDCSESETQNIMANVYSSGLPEGKILRCFDMEPRCQFD